MAYNNNMPSGYDLNHQEIGPFSDVDAAFADRFFTEPSEPWMENIDPILRQAGDEWPPQHQPPIQKWMTERERTWFTAPKATYHPGVLPHVCPIEGVSSLPKASRMVSPSPTAGSQELSSQCSSARSPGAEFDHYPENSYYQPDSFFTGPRTEFSESVSEMFPHERHPHHSFSTTPLGYSYVNLNEVQGFKDVNMEGDDGYVNQAHGFKDVNLEADDGYMNLDSKHEHSIEVDYQMKFQGNTYHHSPTDSGVGASIRDEGSPNTAGTIHVDSTIDPDAEADLEEDDYHPASDTDYTPRSTRNRKRRASTKDTASPNTKRRMTITTKTKKSSLPYACKSCNHAPFKDAAALQRHIQATHTRAFVCVFAFAGCEAAFAAKNEWKRHVSSQHLNFQSWVCTLGPCGKVNQKGTDANGNKGKGAEFNRKDLFTQHLRRMHPPFNVKNQKKKNGESEDKLKELQVSCVRVNRHPPSRLRCPMEGCAQGDFEGQSTWDERMEHVGKHLEKSGASPGVAKFEVHQEDDLLLVEWALRERIIERTPSGQYKLAGHYHESAEDEDAEGEME